MLIGILPLHPFILLARHMQSPDMPHISAIRCSSFRFGSSLHIPRASSVCLCLRECLHECTHAGEAVSGYKASQERFPRTVRPLCGAARRSVCQSLRIHSNERRQKGRKEGRKERRKEGRKEGRMEELNLERNQQTPLSQFCFSQQKKRTLEEIDSTEALLLSILLSLSLSLSLSVCLSPCALIPKNTMQPSSHQTDTAYSSLPPSLPDRLTAGDPRPGKVRKSHTKWKTLNPVWEQEFSFHVSQSLHLSIFFSSLLFCSVLFCSDFLVASMKRTCTEHKNRTLSLLFPRCRKDSLKKGKNEARSAAFFLSFGNEGRIDSSFLPRKIFFWIDSAFPFSSHPPSMQALFWKALPACLLACSLFLGWVGEHFCHRTISLPCFASLSLAVCDSFVCYLSV